MKVDLEKHGSVTVVIPHDAITDATLGAMTEAMDQAVRQGSAGRMVLDLAQVPFVDSAGIEFLLKFAGSGAGMQPRVACIGDIVREALELTSVHRRFSVFDSVEAAVRSYL